MIIRNFIKLISFVGVVTLFASCEKEVDIKVPDNMKSYLVVEGGIETDGPPLVMLSKSIGFTKKIDLNSLQDAFIHGAEVYVSDGNSTIKLREYTLDTSGQASFSFYTVDSADLASMAFRGQVGKSYHLKIIYDGQTYEANTVIANPTPIDSIWYEEPKPIPEKNPTAMKVYVKYKDPDTLGNAVRYFTSINGGEYYPGSPSAYNDEIINGTEVTISLAAGSPPGREVTSMDSIGYFNRGDSVTIKWSAIDRASYTYWLTLGYAAGVIGNPFVSPVNVKGNISNGALGIWCGYSPTYKSIFIPK